MKCEFSWADQESVRVYLAQRPGWGTLSSICCLSGFAMSGGFNYENVRRYCLVLVKDAVCFVFFSLFFSLDPSPALELCFIQHVLSEARPPVIHLQPFFPSLFRSFMTTNSLHVQRHTPCISTYLFVIVADLIAIRCWREWAFLHLRP